MKPESIISTTGNSSRLPSKARSSSAHRLLTNGRRYTLHFLATSLATFVFSIALPVASQTTFVNGVSVQGSVLRIEGEISQDFADTFLIAMLAHPELKKVSLNSPGGRVFPALDIARAIKAAGLSTSVPIADQCHSACSLIFLAGKERIADGKLGVHQISGVTDPSLTQTAIAQIYEDLVSFNTPSYLISRMLRTPPGNMYVFTPEELERNAINMRDANQAGSIPHLQAIETWLRENWLVGVFMNTHTNTPFIALESREMDPLMRIAHYPTRSQTFVEIMLQKGDLSGTTSRIELRFAHGKDQPFSLFVDADIEPNAYAFDIPSDPNEAKNFWVAFTTGTGLTVLNSYGIEIGRFSLAGSQRVFDEFVTLANR